MTKKQQSYWRMHLHKFISLVGSSRNFFNQILSSYYKMQASRSFAAVRTAAVTCQQAYARGLATGKFF